VLGGVRGLVAAAVFKTDEVEYLGLAGSIPVLLRHGRSDEHIPDQRGSHSVRRWSSIRRVISCRSSNSSRGTATRRVVPNA